MTSPISLSFTTTQNNTIPISWYPTTNFANAPTVVYIHGFKGYKDWGFVPYIAQEFASKGINFLCFNFSHNGIGEDMKSFTRLDLFEQNTFSLELSEALEVIEWVATTDALGAFLHAPIGLLGHSRGGGIAILAARQSKWVQCLATWASVCNFQRYDKTVIQLWKKQGYWEVPNLRTGQIMRLGLDILRDVEKNREGALNILKAVHELEIPYLLVHGDRDTSVHHHEAEQLSVYAHPDRTQYELIPEGDHTFGATEPFQGTTPQLEDVMAKTMTFFQMKFTNKG